MELLLDPVGKRAVLSLGSDQDKTIGELSYGEVIPLRIAKVESAGNTGSNLWRPVDISTSAIRVGLGNPLAGPTDGTFSIGWGGDQQGPLNWNMSAAQLGVALANIPALITDGGVTVSDEGNGLFYITFLTVGAKAQFIILDNALVPAATAEIGTVVPGDGSTNEIQSIRLVQLPAVEAVAADFTASDGPHAVVTVIATGGAGVNHKVTVDLDPLPVGGFWTMTVNAVETDLLEYNISAADLTTALSLLSTVNVDTNGNPNVSVTLGAEGRYYVTFIRNKAATNVGTITTTATALEVVQYMEGNLDLRDIDAVRLLGSEDSVSLYLEVEETPSGGQPIKLLRRAVDLVMPVLTVE